MKNFLIEVGKIANQVGSNFCYVDIKPKSDLFGIVTFGYVCYIDGYTEVWGRTVDICLENIKNEIINY